MYSYLDADTTSLWIVHIFIQTDGPAITRETTSRLDNHVAYQLPLVHECSAQSLRTCPALWASAVEVYTVDSMSGE